MFNLTVAFGPASAGAWQFLFKSKQSADKAFDAISDMDAVGTITIEDDHGHKASIPIADIHGVLLEDYGQSSEARIFRGLHEARLQAKANSRGQNDPELKGLAALNGGMMPQGMQRRPGN